MPVTGLILLPASTNPASTNSLSEKLEAYHGARQVEKWVVQYKLYRETLNPNSPKVLHQLFLSQFPKSMFCLINDIVVEMDRDFEGLLKKLNLWTQRQELVSDGTTLDMDEFKVRIGSLRSTTTILGQLIEIEYLPCNNNSAQPVISEFAKDYVFNLTETEAPIVFSKSETDVNSEITLLDIASQYIDLLKRK
ncbi:Mediator of RNA polymerase II transcription subunit 20 [Neolecta irregularis DAH-3]|uniref:Mediator of RNA polymerase II transcription subunit 20 n=1 Tax=Neolecta irregularis (strain DAH-3) TaxID=1198029 RepID=A0A1U7LJL7_NEOID|nr:Mediator of RNA polymerase II transcription subunit 20 [Neolecta irregularis DAH-3]|eukprot:OLL22850.1 Mediator of RNA polymerase II transcription subunit 20 [Neolecta irregularis DAH-3]